MEEARISTLDQFKDKHYGPRGTKKREELESGYEDFKIEAMIHVASLERGLTQVERRAVN